MTGETPSRRNHRLAEFLYQQPGAYFATFVTNDRRCILGSVQQDEFRPSQLGSLCWQHIEALGQRNKLIKLDEFIVMPNHVHLILFYENYARQELPPLTQVIGWLKAGISRDYRKLTSHAYQLWQRDFHDHVIHNEEALYRIRNYVRNNVLQWSLDQENPRKNGQDSFELRLREEQRLSRESANRFIPVREP